MYAIASQIETLYPLSNNSRQTLSWQKFSVSIITLFFSNYIQFLIVNGPFFIVYRVTKLLLLEIGDKLFDESLLSKKVSSLLLLFLYSPFCLLLPYLSSKSLGDVDRTYQFLSVSPFSCPLWTGTLLHAAVRRNINVTVPNPIRHVNQRFLNSNYLSPSVKKDWNISLKDKILQQQSSTTSKPQTPSAE